MRSRSRPGFPRKRSSTPTPATSRARIATTAASSCPAGRAGTWAPARSSTGRSIRTAIASRSRRSPSDEMSVHVSRRDLRLATGLVLFGYVALHLVNHALGLVSVRFAERGLEFALRSWHSLPGTALLYGAACVHLGLAFESLHARRTLRMAPLELTRIVLAF